MPDTWPRVVDPDGGPCTCGGHGCVETIAGGPRMAQWAREQGWDAPRPMPRNGRRANAGTHRVADFQAGRDGRGRDDRVRRRGLRPRPRRRRRRCGQFRRSAFDPSARRWTPTRASTSSAIRARRLPNSVARPDWSAPHRPIARAVGREARRRCGLPRRAGRACSGEVVRAYGQEVEALGYDHLLAYDHVVGADPRHVVGNGYYYVHTPAFHETCSVMFGDLARSHHYFQSSPAVPEFPAATALVALKAGRRSRPVVAGQVPARGRNRLERRRIRRTWRRRRARCAVGGTDQTLAAVVDRAQRQRRGQIDTVTGAGLAPLPVQRPIPVRTARRRRRATNASAGSPMGGFR